MNGEEKIREDILKFLHTARNDARVVERAFQNEQQIFRALRENYKRPEIVRNLLYLVENKWVKTKSQNKVTYYKISNLGVDYFDDLSSVFQKKTFYGVNVTNVNGVVIVGNDNIVQQKYTELFQNLDKLKAEIGHSKLISDSEKINYHSEIDTIKSQLAKKEPNHGIISQAWSGLSSVATISGIIQFYQQIEPLIKHLIGQ